MFFGLKNSAEEKLEGGKLDKIGGFLNIKP